MFHLLSPDALILGPGAYTTPQPPHGVLATFVFLSLFPTLNTLCTVSLNWPVRLLQPESLLSAATACICYLVCSPRGNPLSVPFLEHQICRFPHFCYSSWSTPLWMPSQVATGSSHNGNMTIVAYLLWRWLSHACLPGVFWQRQSPRVSCCGPAFAQELACFLNFWAPSFANPALFISDVHFNTMSWFRQKELFISRLPILGRFWDTTPPLGSSRSMFKHWTFPNRE